MVQRLPLELLAEILGHVSVPDILRFEQVNRNFRDAIRATPLLQHKVDLFSAGLEYNAGAGVSLDDSRKALLQYRSSLDSLRPTEVRVADRLWPDQTEFEYSAGGVYPNVDGSSLRLFTMGPTSRGVPQKEWEIPLPVVNLAGYGLCPEDDVIAFVDLQEANLVEIHLRSLSDGACHPAAGCPTIRYWGVKMNIIFSVPITSSRLAVCASVHDGIRLVIWDWKGPQLLFELNVGRRGTAEFIDEYRLLASVKATFDEPPSLVVIDTGKETRGAPVQTTFCLPPSFSDTGHLFLLLERSAHRPPPVEALAPFHQDPAQRIIALAAPYFPYHLIFQVGQFLGLLQSREGSKIGWDGWKGCVVVPSIDRVPFRVWVSGCRLFCVGTPDNCQGAQMEVFDFGMKGRGRYVSKRVNEILGGVSYLSSTGVRRRVPCDDMLIMSSSGRSTGFSYWVLEDGREGKAKLHIWIF